MSVAGCSTIIEAWLQAKVTIATRGRALGVYRVVDIVGNPGAPLLIGFLEPAVYLSYDLLALFTLAAPFPLVLPRAEAPETGAAPRLRPMLAWRRSPLASAGVIVSGITGAAFRMVGSLYGLAVGLAPDRIALFLAACVLGGAFAQWPVGWLADKFDRRRVPIGLGAASTLACGLTVLGAQGGVVAFFRAAGFYGVTTFPIYSVSAAHAHDFARQDERVELSAALLFLYAVGAIASPLIAAGLIAALGPPGMCGVIAIAHVALVVFGLVRMRARPAPADRRGFVETPKTSLLIGWLLRRGKD